MGVFRSGVDQFYPWTLYSVGYIPRVAHHVSYREALTIAYPHWLRGIAKYHAEDILSLVHISRIFWNITNVPLWSFPGLRLHARSR